MSGSGGVTTARARGDGRFYVSPAMRKPHVQLQQQQQRRRHQQNSQQPQQQPQQRYQPQQQQQQQKPANPPMNGTSPEIEKRVDADQCRSSSTSSTASNCSVPGRPSTDGIHTNLDRFLEFTTPVVAAQLQPKTSVKGWRRGEEHHQHPYFVLDDLWESLKEWSAYGVGVPLLLDGSETVIQYYVPYLSGIQLYKDASKQSTRRRHGEDSDTESSRETSSDSSSDYGGAKHGARGPWNQQNGVDSNVPILNGLSLRSKPSRGSSSDENDISNNPGQLIFEYMEHESPFHRQPLADQIAVLASQFPELKTCKSCDLTPASWMSVAWYPIYRIPTGPTLQNLDACFLTFHSLSTPSAFQGRNTDGIPIIGTRMDAQSADMSKLSLYSFGLASYKLKASFWIPNGTYDCPKVNSLQRAAETWLRLLQVNHPDYMFFVSHSSSWR
ncbi:unnamed protein product [Linum tenue]|uniref:Uncharacterized protein n=1 Tax=Linum tenue TaxID=586396 RepID=A0AAV0P8L7_9ROSI|nr:unnamed protein product [Linum tenue]